MSVRLDHGKDELDEMHEINVTPFIDVMLVLLIIFMVAAPLATVDIAVDLPSSTAQPQARPEKPLFLTVKPDLSLSLGDEPVAREDLAQGPDIQSPQMPPTQEKPPEKAEEKIELPPPVPQADVVIPPELVKPPEVPKEETPPPQITAPPRPRPPSPGRIASW